MTYQRAARRLGAYLVATAFLSGCAGVNFYSDAELTKKTGIPIYGVKPYLLVARTQAKDKPVEVSIQYLTDSSKVIYADPRSGFGSADLKLSLDHGQLTQFGQITDTKIPELLNAVGGFLTSRATSIETLAKADQIRSGAAGTTTQGAKIPDAKTLADIKALLDDMTSKNATAQTAQLYITEQRTVQKVQSALRDLLNPAKVGMASALGDQLIAAEKEFAKLPDPPAVPSARTTGLVNVQAWKPRLAAIVAAITPEAAPQPDFELYEIQQRADGIHLHRVAP